MSTHTSTNTNTSTSGHITGPADLVTALRRALGEVRRQRVRGVDGLAVAADAGGGHHARGRVVIDRERGTRGLGHGTMRTEGKDAAYRPAAARGRTDFSCGYLESVYAPERAHALH